jgi:homoserine O-acetyltransferase/O-succinyltransferase
MVEKKAFDYPGVFTTHGGATIAQVRVGYETHGTLNAARDNAILVPHYNTGNSHFAGKYKESDALPGYWDAIVGPGKALDTDKYFFIGVDSLCNANANDGITVTTGPASIDPATGKHYGMRFPTVQIRDFVNVQKALLEHLGISKLHAIVGASMGSIQAFEWAAVYPNWVARVIGVVPSAFVDDFTALRLRLLREIVMLDPKWNGGEYYGTAGPLEGLRVAVLDLNCAGLAPDWSTLYNRAWADATKNPVDSMSNGFASGRAIDDTIAARIALLDANNFMYLQRANELFTVGGKSTLAEGLSTITARVLLLPSINDQLLAPEGARAIRDVLQARGNHVEYQELRGPLGHYNALFAIDQASPAMSAFLAS